MGVRGMGRWTLKFEWVSYGCEGGEREREEYERMSESDEWREREREGGEEGPYGKGRKKKKKKKILLTSSCGLKVNEKRGFWRKRL